MLELECAINELTRLEIALDAADRAVDAGDLNRAGWALDLAKLALDDTRRRLKNTLAEQRATTVGKRQA